MTTISTQVSIFEISKVSISIKMFSKVTFFALICLQWNFMQNFRGFREVFRYFTIDRLRDYSTSYSIYYYQIPSNFSGSLAIFPEISSESFSSIPSEMLPTIYQRMLRGTFSEFGTESYRALQRHYLQ